MRTARRDAHAQRMLDTFTHEALAFLRRKGMGEPLLFQQRVSLTDVKRLKAGFSTNPNAVAECDDVHLISNALLFHMRELRTPVWPSEALSDPSRPGVVLHSLIALSEPQFHTLWNMMRLIRDYCNSVAGTQSGETSAMVDVVAPILCRPAHAAFMSVKHMKQLQVIQQCVWQLLDEQDTLFARAHRTRARAAAEAEAAAAAGAAGPLHISPTNASGSDGDGNGSPTRSPAKLMIRVASSNFVPDRDVAAAEQALGGAVGLLLRGENMFSLPRAAATQVWDAQQNVLCSRLGCARWMERRSEAMLSRRSLRLARVQQCRTMREELKEVVDEVTHNSGSLRGTYALLLQDYRTLKRSIRDEAATFLQAMLRGWLCRRRLRAAAQRGHGKRHSSTASMPGFAAALTRNGNSGAAAASAAGGGKEDARRLPVLSPGTASIGIISPSSSAGATTPASSPPGGIVRGMPPGFDPSVRVNIGGSAALGSEVLNGVKRAVKSKLKEYDAAFRRAHNRLPSKPEKEPIRYMYERYHDVKALLDDMAASHAAGEVRPADMADAALKAEKRTLQVALRRYEREFERVFSRKVKFHRDIEPVALQYQRYKGIKGELERRKSK